ncbi:uncharacterized protein EDB91DRAFT_1237655 [Suillus paluster]|uniref:uncharacterized protein n=1 Tax=Suillus paluster TaxID=48578 RepID=UPI001B8869E8|nr:uncharacterized protein EDB91DRAFT_1237655 [Suillus paluster]KAG1738872.1 hypothetical protein EDB91DRAFT_1237655 [Suillus paluster]
MGIEERWMTTHPERVRVQSRIANVQYHKAVDDVERLVVMRLLELMKLQMSGLCYKLRTQIAKALKTCATVIRNALNRYNKYAAQLNPPPPPPLTTNHLGTDTDNQLQDKCWAIPRNRQASAKYFDLQRSKEEIIQDDTINFPVIIVQLRISDPPLAGEVQRRWDHICSIEALPGYSGSRAAGTRVGHMDSTPLQAQPEADINDRNVDDDAYDDPDGKQQTLMEDFFEQLHDGPVGTDEV